MDNIKLRRIKKAIGILILSSFVVGLIYCYADMVIKEGWWRGLIMPVFLMAGMVSIMGFAIWLIVSSNKK